MQLPHAAATPGHARPGMHGPPTTLDPVTPGGIRP
jgi:hypothetical protein